MWHSAPAPMSSWSNIGQFLRLSVHAVDKMQQESVKIRPYENRRQEIGFDWIMGLDRMQ